MTTRMRIAVRGVVQGVGFRPFVFNVAARLGVRGFVANRVDDVLIEAEAEPPVLASFVDEIRARPPGGARIDDVATEPLQARGEEAFRIVASDERGARSAVIAPDVATCDACVDEILDPASRRFGYAFTSCATCGPRVTIVTGAPYDRARTTMAPFELCDACRREHDDPTDRRFHAQPIACPACGPKVRAPGLRGEAIAAVAAALRDGAVVAVKGLGGYHFACDATREDVVAELRRRKHRDEKPFAVMVADVAAARAVAELDVAEVALLSSSARPIVLVRRRGRAALAPGVAPGMADVGLMLPYTPLHHLLLRAFGGPLVMTSGNRSDEPIAFDDEDAKERLADIADRWLVHDRAIHMRCEDSVARVVGGAPMLLRRSRGYAPAPLRLHRPIDVPTLALGGQQKAVFALAERDQAFLSPHFGDLDDASAYRAFTAAIRHFSALHRITPARVVCDRHPDYASSRLGAALAREGMALLEVGHHHAHMASVIADAGVVGPAIGVCFDGTGLGDDGTIWGGEFLVGTCRTVRRAAHLAAMPLPGGDRAAYQPWRVAVAYLHAAGWTEGALVDRFGGRARAIAGLCTRPAFAPRSSSAGRLFDAVAMLAGVGDRVRFEAQPAVRLEELARSASPDGAYPFVLSGVEPIVIETAGIVAAVARDIDRGEPAAVVARRFHTTVVELIAAACTSLASSEGLDQVVLSGGCFQNAILAAEVPVRLAKAGLRVHTHRQVPPNDGGLCLGQLAIAAAQAGGG